MLTYTLMTEFMSHVFLLAAILQISMPRGKEWQEAGSLALRSLPNATHSDFSTCVITPVEQDSLASAWKAGDSVPVLVVHAGDRIAGFAIVDNVRGKDQPITYCVITDSLLHVRAVEILAYREQYGGEVRNSSWLEQFAGKQPGDALRPGRDIRNITGATISSRAVTLGVKRVLMLLRVLRPRFARHEGSGP